MVASSWISHYRIITYLKRSSSLFIILNVLFLASIVFLPVPVAFFYQYGNQIGSLLVFACTQLVTSVTLLLMWVEALVDHLLDPAIPPEYLDIPQHGWSSSPLEPFSLLASPTTTSG